LLQLLPPHPPRPPSLKTRKMTQNLECLTSLDSSCKQKNWKKMKLFSFLGGGGGEGELEDWKKKKDICVVMAG